ncbi:uncharacterized protein RCO7_02262 [Rhynchosporium graminicola]|uniref:Uncharacterized protein n=1 Tax=Rhynchosporium graminicola TaxID=2792576 RepID=A0A1E1LHG0_9HELO|nr:uncharacterized protein RCO7_02262 [Rhynchosporium commune]
MYLPEDDADAFDSLVIYIFQNLLPAFPTEKHPAIKEGLAKLLYLYSDPSTYLTYYNRYSRY